MIAEEERPADPEDHPFFTPLPAEPRVFRPPLFGPTLAGLITSVVIMLVACAVLVVLTRG